MPSLDRKACFLVGMQLMTVAYGQYLGREGLHRKSGKNKEDKTSEQRQCDLRFKKPKEWNDLVEAEIL